MLNLMVRKVTCRH